MQDTQTPPAGSPFGLSGDQYWAKPMDQASVIAYGTDMAFKGREGRGIHIDVPPKVFLDKRKTVPLIAFNSNSLSDVHHFALRKTASIVLTHLETGKVGMTKAADTPVRDLNEPDGEPEPGWTVEDLVADAAEAGLGPRLGRYAVFMLNGPDASETRTFSVFPSAAAESASETKAALKALRVEGGSPQPTASVKSLRLRHEPLPQLKDGAMPWQLAAGPGATEGHRVHLGFRIAGLPRFVHPGDKPILDEEGKRVLATLPVFLVAFDENRIVAFSRHLGVPVIAGPGVDPEAPILAGHVSFDLETLAKPLKAGSKLTLWAIAMDRKAKLEIAW